MPPSLVVVVLHECERMIYDRVVETLILISYMFGSVRDGFLKGGTEMFQDNLKTLCKNKGITQEKLAARLKVVRQIISK